MRGLIIIFSSFLFCSCNKENPTTKTFTGVLPIVSTISPVSITAGENIFSSVRCELTEISGSVYFTGFNIKQTSPTHYDISAEALYKDWNTQLALPVMWTMDTSIIIKTTKAGEHVLSFYNNSYLVKSDTVQVN